MDEFEELAEILAVFRKPTMLTKPKLTPEQRAESRAHATKVIWSGKPLPRLKKENDNGS